MIFIKKFLFLSLIYILFAATILVDAKPTYAAISGDISAVRQSFGALEVDYKVNNSLPMEPTPGIAISIFSLGITCNTGFNADINDPNNSFNSTVPLTATCNMGSAVRGSYDVVLYNQASIDQILDTYTINYAEGAPDNGEGYFVGAPTRSTGGLYTFNIYLGTASFDGQWANIALDDKIAHWQSGAEYTCDKTNIPFDWGWDGDGSKNVQITCNFSSLPPGVYNMTLYDSDVTSSENELDDVTFAISLMDLKPPDPQNNVSFPNKFDISTERYTSAAPTAYYIKIKDPVDGSITDHVSYLGGSSVVGVSTMTDLDFNMLPPGTYDLLLVDTSNNILDEEPIVIKANSQSDTCTCRTTTMVYSCSPTPVMEVQRNSCVVGKAPEFSCLPSSVTGGAVSCSCNCAGTAAINPGGIIPPEFDADDLGSFFKLAQNIIIAIAVISGVFIVPYAFVLMASGNPEKIKQGTDWLKSIFWGYLIIFLSGVLIRIVGGEILSLGF